MSQLHCREGVGKTKAELDAAAKAALDAFHLCPNLDILVPALVEGGPGELQRRCSLTPGVLGTIGQVKRALAETRAKVDEPRNLNFLMPALVEEPGRAAAPLQP